MKLWMAQERFEGGKRHRSGEVITLKNIAATAFQKFHLGCRFHAFGDHNEAKVVGHGNNALGDRCIVMIGSDFPDERTVDLDLVDRQTLEVAEAGKTGPEVIECNANPQCLESVQRLDRLFSVMQQQRLGDLQLQLFTSQTVFLQRGLDILHEMATLKMHW